LLIVVTDLAEISLFACRRQGPYHDPLVIWDIFACEERARARMHRNHVLRRGNGRGEPVLMFRKSLCYSVSVTGTKIRAAYHIMGPKRDDNSCGPACDILEWRFTEK